MNYGMKGTRSLARAIGLSLALSALAACGGGGGGGGNVRPNPPPAPPPTTNPPPEPPEPPPATDQPDIDAHLVLTNWSGAYSEGITGLGVTIGVVDSGIRRDHPALDGRVAQNLFYLDPLTNDQSVDDKVGHGTLVAQIAGGKAFGQWPGGIAPDASFVSARIISDEPPEDDGSGQGNEVSGADGMDLVHQDLIDAGARIMNNSWGGLYWTGDAVTSSFVEAYKPFVVDWGGLVVFATGNESKPQPSDTAALPSMGAGADVLERGWLAVAALDTLNPTQLASYSNACGIAMNYCLVAPGDVVATGVDDTANDPTYRVIHGTSFAAPQVSGAAALVWQKFPYFDNDQVRQTLLGTAKDLGAPGADPIFGHGLLDIGKAMRGPSKFDWGDVHVHLPPATVSTWWNDISGDGGLILDGDGQVVDGIDDTSFFLNGKNTFKGGLRITGGATVAVNGSLDSDIVVDPGAYLYAWEVTVNGDILNRGVMQINSPQYFESPTVLKGNVINDGIFLSRDFPNTDIEGSFSQTEQAQFWAILGGPPLHISGAAEIDGQLHMYKVAEGYVAKHQTEVLIADGGVSGQFDWLTSDPSILLQATIGYGPDRVWLDVDHVDVTGVSGMAYTPGSLSAAQRVQGAFVQLDQRFADAKSMAEAQAANDAFAIGAGKLQRTESLQALQRSLESLSGELHSADAAFALMAIEGNRYALESRVDALQSSPVDAGAWRDGLKAQRAMSRFDIDSDGWMMGYDQRHGEHLTFGSVLAQTDGYARHELRADRERNRQIEAQMYASAGIGDNYLLGSVAAGRMQRWMQREIVLGADAFQIDSSYANRYGTLGLQGGHRFAWGNAQLTPYLGAQALRLDRDGFSEQGAAGFGLSAAGSSLNASQALLGARFNQDWRLGSVSWTLQGRIEWQRLLSQSSGDIDARFTALDVWSPIGGGSLDRDVGVFGLGLGTRFGGGSHLSFDLDGRHENGETYTRAQATWSITY